MSESDTRIDSAYHDQLNEISKRSVVILGSRIYREKMIDKISSTVLDDGNFVPTIAYKLQQTFDRHQTPRQRINLLLAIASFVIAEDSVSSGEIVELEYCRNLGVTTAVLHDESLPRSSWMTLDVDIHCADFRCFPYKKDNLENKVREAIKWAEKRNQEKMQEFLKKEKIQEEKNEFFRRGDVKRSVEKLRDLIS